MIIKYLLSGGKSTMKSFKKIIAVLLSLLMLTGTVQLASFAENGDQTVKDSMPFVSISDLHVFAESEMGNRGSEWMDFCRLDSKMYNESETIIRTGLDTIVERAKDSGAKYVLVPGDLTKDSEYAGHIALAKILEEYEEKYGLEFLVINGNHDINETGACTFKNDVKESARAITFTEFTEVYKNLGYDLAIERYAGTGEKVPGALSYVADLDEGYRLIVVDSCKYSFDEPQKQETGGAFSPELMQWIKKWADKSKEDGRVPMIMLHHSVAPHMQVEPSITHAFIVENYVEIAEQLAAWGIHYAFTGHLHVSDAACVTNDDGDTIYDFQADSLTGYPNAYREFLIETLSNGESRMSSEIVDFDDKAKMTFDGVTYDNNTYKYKAFGLCFGGGTSKSGKADAGAFAVGLIKYFLGGMIGDINAVGGILQFLKTKDIDLAKILGDLLAPYIGDGIKIGSYNIFSVDNLIWFIEDLLNQVSDLYLKDPQKLYDVLTPAVEKLVNFQVSDLPCTKFIDDYGFGNKDKPGTLGDAVLSAMLYWYAGNEDASDDAFLRDVIDGFENGDTFGRFFNLVVDTLLHDIIEDAILAKLEIRLDKLFGDTHVGKKLGEAVNMALSGMLRNDFTYMNLVKIVFAYEILPWTDLYDVLDQLLLQKYLTPSFLQGLGQFVAYVLKDFTSDYNPKFAGDYGVTYTSSKVDVEATTRNYRLPTMVSQTLGEDSQTEATISWFSKSTLDADIEIYKAESEPEFTGTPTKNADFEIDLSSESVERSYPGIDLGIFGLFQYAFKLNRNTVKLSKLEKGATYYYRVGNAKYGWWSQTGSVTTADGSNDVTFFHMCDPQSMNDRQYSEKWAKILDSAFSLYPDAKFIVNTGDLVDQGDNSKQWQGMFDTGSKYLMNSYLMPASGNHEGMGTNATANFFVLPNLPEQDTSTGVYYSYTYNNAHFAVLNSEFLNEDEALDEAQIEWLKKDMNDSNAMWKFVVLHKAPYSQGSHYKDDDVCAIRDQLSVLMPQLGIDMVFQGHDHVYMRTASLINNEKEAAEITYLEKDGNVYKTKVLPKGTSYVISGCAGVKTYLENDSSKTDKYFPRGEKVLALETPMYSVVEIENGILYFNAYTVDGDETIKVDSFAIQKNTNEGKVVENTEQAEEEIKENEFIAFLKTLLTYLLKIAKVAINLVRIYVLNVEL